MADDQIEKSIKRKRNGRLAPLPTEFNSHPHLIRTHALLNHFETIGISPENTALPPSVASTPQHMSMSTSSSGRMTLRDRRKNNEEEVTPPPTVARRGRGTPRGKAQGGPSTPIARKAVTSKFVTPPHSHLSEEIDTPTAAPTISKSDSAFIPNHHPKLELKPEPISNTQLPPLDQTVQPPPSDAQTQGQTAKIILRFTRPTPLPPAELASLPSPITPLPPLHSTIYPNISRMNDQPANGSIDQRTNDSRGESGDYMGARDLHDDGRESPRLPGAF
jgi:hypothetical protein